MQVEGQHGLSLLRPMATVSNAYPTCRSLRDSLSKERLIRDGMHWPHGLCMKDSSDCDGDAFH